MEREPVSAELLDERALVRRMSKGDRGAVDLFVRHYTPMLIRYAHAHLSARHPDAVTDLVQSTLIAGIERLETFRGDGSLAAWLTSICRFKIATYRKRQKVREDHAGEAPRDFDRLPSPDDLPSTDFERRELAATVHSTLEQLPPPYGDVLEWKYLEHAPVSSIAERLEISPKAAESLLARARSAFRRLFDLSSSKQGAR